MQSTDRVETAKLTNLPMGSAIPDWLLVAEPLQAGAPKGAWRFDCDVLIMELPGDFFVVPIIPLGVASSCSVLDFAGMSHHSVDAASKPVRVIHQMNHFFPVEFRPAIQATRDAIAAQQAPVVAPSAPPPVGIVRRWWQALFG